MLCATQNVEELIPALYQGELGEGAKAGTRVRPERSGSRRKQELETDTLHFASHQTLDLKAIWFEQRVEDFEQLHREWDRQCSKEKANRQRAMISNFTKAFNRSDGGGGLQYSTNRRPGRIYK